MRTRLALPVLVLVVALLPTSVDAGPKGIPPFSEWIDSRHGWAFDGGLVHATVDGGRTWRLVFRGSNYIFNPTLRTSRSAGLVSTGRQAGGTFWTNDAGRHWYGTAVVDLSAFTAGRGNLLFWHRPQGDTLYRVEGWPPRGDFACRRLNPDWGPPAPGHPLCAAPSNDAGMRSVVVARLDRGAFGPMRSVTGGAFAVVQDTNDIQVGLYRHGSLSVTRLPEAPAGAEPHLLEIAAAWPRLYATIGSVLWRSGDGGRTWSVITGPAEPRPLTRVRGRARIGARAWLPGGFVASARVGSRRVLLIRQLGRTRLHVLPGSANCSALEPRMDWPQLFVEGRRAGRTVAVWRSDDGGSRWTRFGQC